MTQSAKRVAVLGASGYTGAELLRLLLVHPYAEIVALVGDSSAGKPIASIYPHFNGVDLPEISTLDAVDWTHIDVAFCCLPHGASQKTIAAIPSHVVVIDLSADYRLRDADVYEQWYGEPHLNADLLAEAVYGLSEINREAIAEARIIACPGCYPTSVQLPLIPLLKLELITGDMLVIDAKSGVTGAGRATRQSNIFCEINEGVGAYAVGSHRHCPEIEQGLSLAAGRNVTVSFTPHLIPMNRGILSTIYASLDIGVTVNEVRNGLKRAYEGLPFVTICDENDPIPTTHQVRGSNRCIIGVYPDRQAGRVIIISVIDNLLKGASGQALQNFNIKFAFDETTGLGVSAFFP
ncbi:MAG: N-acetyl-gamma-glutamyl-phosphate reductase [Alphaproteobacteria bacterium]|nr:N-acetyl-gamma-glutamyl-phosphate reductase [Alphaproteobacteria bacterium]